ncbi:hypothetical protein TNCV_4323151 [Trichonephila clavipes]|nr:hypothetical protein TNCV_4323151 [Trichonephila clavipes]
MRLLVENKSLRKSSSESDPAVRLWTKPHTLIGLTVSDCCVKRNFSHIAEGQRFSNCGARPKKGVIILRGGREHIEKLDIWI